MNYGEIIELGETSLEFVEDIDESTCTGCFFQDAPYSSCPKDENGYPWCSQYSRGPTGVFVEVKNGR